MPGASRESGADGRNSVRTIHLSRVGTAVVLAGGLGIGIATGAIATKGPGNHPEICHPVEGKGELGNGWNLISPDKASSHIDESKYPNGVYWKHQTRDGRHDVYAVNGTCPSSPTPTDTHTGGTPSPTTTSGSPTTTPCPSTTTPGSSTTSSSSSSHSGTPTGSGTSPTSTGSPSSTDTSSPTSPPATSSTTSRPSTTTPASATSSRPPQTTTSTSTASAPPTSPGSSTSSTPPSSGVPTSPSPRRTATLAFTGAGEITGMLATALALIGLGVVSYRARRSRGTH